MHFIISVILEQFEMIVEKSIQFGTDYPTLGYTDPALNRDVMSTEKVPSTT